MCLHMSGLAQSISTPEILAPECFCFDSFAPRPQYQAANVQEVRQVAINCVECREICSDSPDLDARSRVTAISHDLRWKLFVGSVLLEEG